MRRRKISPCSLNDYVDSVITVVLNEPYGIFPDRFTAQFKHISIGEEYAIAVLYCVFIDHNGEDMSIPLHKIVGVKPLPQEEQLIWKLTIGSHKRGTNVS
jgi:hypothetical protein